MSSPTTKQPYDALQLQPEDTSLISWDGGGGGDGYLLSVDAPEWLEWHLAVVVKTSPAAADSSSAVPGGVRQLFSRVQHDGNDLFELGECAPSPSSEQMGKAVLLLRITDEAQASLRQKVRGCPQRISAAEELSGSGGDGGDRQQPRRWKVTRASLVQEAVEILEAHGGSGSSSAEREEEKGAAVAADYAAAAAGLGRPTVAGGFGHLPSRAWGKHGGHYALVLEIFPLKDMVWVHQMDARWGFQPRRCFSCHAIFSHTLASIFRRGRGTAAHRGTDDGGLLHHAHSTPTVAKSTPGGRYGARVVAVAASERVGWLQVWWDRHHAFADGPFLEHLRYHYGDKEALYFALHDSMVAHMAPLGALGVATFGAAPLRAFWRPGLTDIYLCNVCSCQEILRRNGAASVLAAGPRSVPALAGWLLAAGDVCVGAAVPAAMGSQRGAPEAQVGMEWRRTHHARQPSTLRLPELVHQEFDCAGVQAGRADGGGSGRAAGVLLLRVLARMDTDAANLLHLLL
jgi:hypothetical protein